MSGQRQRGFTLIEMLMSLAVISILMALSLPLYQSFQTRTDLNVASDGIVDMLRRAQIYARGVQGDSPWSVRVQSGSAILYKGVVYASRDTTYDETVAIPSPFAVSGLTDISFAKFSAAPSTTGSLVLTGLNNETRTITLNAKGMVAY